MSFEGTNLLGDDYKEYVRDQIIQRQSRLGKNTKTSEDISWMNGKTAYFRLASSVDISDTFDLIPVTGSTTLENPDLLAIQDMTGVPSNGPFSSDLANIKYFAPEEVPGAEVDKVKYTEAYHVIESSRTGDARLEFLGLPPEFKGDNLAKFLVLHGGSEKALNNKSLQKRYGIISKYSSLSDNLSAYGFKDKDWGFVGMPGVESVDIKSRNMGSLREASISLRVNSAEQLKLIDVLYFRLGYSIFLEWGNSSHFDNEGNYKRGADIDYSLLFDFLEPSNEIKKSPLKFLELIESAREKSNGNYDAMLGKVKNFTWEFNPQGYYTANLSIISWGDIVESLKIDGWYPDVKSRQQLEGETPEEEKFQGISKDNESALNKFIHEASLPSNLETSGLVIPINPLAGYVSFDSYKPTKKTLIAESAKNKTFLGYNIPFIKQRIEASDYSAVLNYNRSETNSSGKIISGWALFGPESTPYYYIRFGDLLDFIKTKLLLYVGEELTDPIIDINTDPDKNYCFNPGTNVSADPSKVMIRRNPPGLLTYTEGFWKRIGNITGFGGDGKMSSSGLVYNHPIFQGKLSGQHGEYDVTLEEFDTSYNGQLAGNIMNIYLEKGFLYSTIDNLRDQKTGKLPLFNFLKDICNAINDSLGGVNQLDVRIKNDQTLEIYDQVPIPGTKLNKFTPGYKYPAELSLYGIPLQNNTQVLDNGTLSSKINRGGSFVTNFGIKTEITNELASTIAIGAQANNKVVGEDATIFSKWNFGLIDRIYPEKVDSRIQTPEESDYEREELEGLTRKMLMFYGDYQFQYLTNDDGFWKDIFKAASTFQIDDHSVYGFPRVNPQQFGSYVKLQKDYFKALFKYQSKVTQVPSNQIGMIPINLNLEMDGISGIRIYDQLHVDTTFLPNYYNDTLIFIIKGVSHKFQGNRWVTLIDTIAQPKVIFNSFKPSIQHSPEDSSDTTNTATTTSSTSDESSTTTITPDTTSATQTLPNDLGYSQPLTTLITRDYYSQGKDPHGSGAYGASRGSRSHKGIDLVSSPGETVFAAISGIARATGPYSSPSPKQKTINTGVKIIGTGDFSGMTVYSFYTRALPGIIGKEVTSGQPIGTALDITGVYPGITNHVHFQIGKSSGGNVNSEEWLRENFIVDNGVPQTQPQIASGDVVNPSTKAFQTLALNLKKIFTLTDTYGSNGTPLFTPYKGIFNDNEEGADGAIQVWISSIENTELVSKLDSKDFIAFQEQLAKLRGFLRGRGQINDNVRFSPPSNPSWTLTINSDF